MPSQLDYEARTRLPPTAASVVWIEKAATAGQAGQLDSWTAEKKESWKDVTNFLILVLHTTNSISNLNYYILTYKCIIDKKIDSVCILHISGICERRIKTTSTEHKYNIFFTHI